MTRTDILEAARAEAIPTGTSGLWFIWKHTFEKDTIAKRGSKLCEIPAGTYTYLCHMDEQHLMQNPPGEVVMEDTEEELSKHLDFIMRAFGQVLLTGLGLGCVARGLLRNPRVEKVTIVERSLDVLKLVGRYLPSDPRLNIVLADALHWVPNAVLHGHKWDCAWHDLWSDESRGEPHLQVLHSRLIMALASKTAMQGAWALPREFRRACRVKNCLNVI